MTRKSRFKYRAFALFAALALMFASVPASSAATGGKCGDDLYWSFDKNVLTISGTGEMYDFIQKTAQNKPGEPPWRLHDTSVSKIVIEEGCESIGNYAFYGFSPLVSVVFPEMSLKKIGSYSFSRCASLATVRLPDSVASIGKDAFSRCTSLKTFNFGKASASVPQNMFANDTLLTDVTMSPNCREVLSYAFNSCTALAKIDLSNIERIGSLSFQSCPLTSVSFGKNLKYMETNAFYGCSSLNEVLFDDDTEPESVSNLFLNQTPYYSSLPSGIYTMFGGKVLMNKGTYSGSSLDIAEGIEIIADGAFDGATKLASVTFPSTLRVIGSYAFRDCKKLLSVFIPSGVEVLSSNCLGKYTENMSYVSLDGFTIHSKGCEAALTYASDEALGYVCDHEFEYIEEFGGCTAGGYIKKVCRWCSACTEKTSVPASEHIYPDEWTVVSLPSCSLPGEISAVCEKCGFAIETVYLEKTAHIPSENYEVVSSPSCLEGGIAVKVCTACGEVVDRKELDAAGHVPETAPRALTLPSEDGTTCGCSVTVCSVCHEILSVEWTDAGGNTVPDGAASALSSARSVILCEADIGIASIDLNSDGTFSAKDLKGFAALVK